MRREASAPKLKTFSISFRGRSFDESRYIREVATQYGTEHEQLDLNPEVNLQGAIEEIAYYADEPNADAGALPVWFLSKMCKPHATVMLSGEGADELFGGYLTYRANHLAAMFRGVPQGCGVRCWRARACLPVSDDKIGFEYKVKRFLEGSLMPPERAHVFWNGTFSERAKSWLGPQRSCQRRSKGVMGELREASRGADGYAPYLWFDQKYFLADDILVKSIA